MGARTCVAWRHVLFAVNRNIHFSFIYGASLIIFIHVRARERSVPWAGLNSVPAEARAAPIIMTTEKSARTLTHTHTHSLTFSLTVGLAFCLSVSLYLSACLSLYVCLSVSQTDRLQNPPLTGGLPQLSCCPPPPPWIDICKPVCVCPTGGSICGFDLLPL